MTRTTFAILIFALATFACRNEPGSTGASPDLAKSAVEVDRSEGIFADGHDSAQVTVTVVDRDGNALEGVSVEVALSGEGGAVGPVPPTDAEGVTRASITSLVAETKTVTAQVSTASGPETLAQHALVTFVQRAQAVSIGTQPHQVTAGETFAPVTVVASGSGDEHIPTAEGEVTLSLQDGTPALQGTLTRPLVGGIATFDDLRMEKAGTGFRLIASSPDYHESLGPPFDILPAAPTDATSTVSAAPSALVVADGVTASTITVTVRDAFGNPVPGQDVQLAATGAPATFTQPGPTDAQGAATAQAIASTPGGVTVTATVGSSLVLSQTATVEFVACAPQSVESCYSGTAGTAGVGACQAGTRTCDAAGAWGPCVGEVVPVAEICANSTDDDCDGQEDESGDLDGDGWGTCDNDCCDATAQCADPAKVNPGALELASDGVDNDCDPATLDTSAPPGCSPVQDLNVASATDAARAMELCQFTTANPPLAQKKWGVISADYRLSDGATPSAAQLNDITTQQVAVLTHYGTGGIIPQAFNTMLALSSGVMRTPSLPGYLGLDTDHGHVSAPPPQFLAAHGNQLVTRPGCPTGSGAYDPVNLVLTLRVPTNVTAMAWDHRYFSADFKDFVCNFYNDHHLALVTTGAAIPQDRNVAFDSLGNPVTFNFAWFESCVAQGIYTCPAGTIALSGTGLEVDGKGAGTGWLTATTPVVPGETVTVELMVFDVQDGNGDSVVLLDNFRWIP